LNFPCSSRHPAQIIDAALHAKNTP
jgi:hypothetical protein